VGGGTGEEMADRRLEEKTGGELCSKQVIANLLNLDERRVEQLAQKRIIPKAGRGKFDLHATVRAYVMYLQQRTVGGGDSIDVTEYKDRLLRATVLEAEEKAKLREMARREKEDELIDRSEITAQWVARCVELKAALLAIPVQVGFRFLDPDIRNMVEEEVEAAIYEILETYSRGDIGRQGKLDGRRAGGAEAAGEDKR
jgi:phage terminase Nu1 subunit (DNA packaging protein)